MFIRFKFENERQTYANNAGEVQLQDQVDANDDLCLVLRRADGQPANRAPLLPGGPPEGVTGVPPTKARVPCAEHPGQPVHVQARLTPTVQMEVTISRSAVCTLKQCNNACRLITTFYKKRGIKTPVRCEKIRKSKTTITGSRTLFFFKKPQPTSMKNVKKIWTVEDRTAPFKRKMPRKQSVV